jgi:hypothetical protein
MKLVRQSLIFLIECSFIFQLLSDIRAGRRQYNFEIQLPPDIPSSLEGGYGHIRYGVIVKIDLPWAKDYEFEEIFTVVPTIDENSDPSLLLPAEEEVTKHFCCFFCESDPLLFVIKVPKTGYVPGEELQMHAIVNNPTSTEITHLEVGLIKRFRYQSTGASGKSRNEGIRVFDQDTGAPLKRGTREYFFKFKIPDTPEIVPSLSSEKFKVVQLQYFLSVKAYVWCFFYKFYQLICCF